MHTLSSNILAAAEIGPASASTGTKHGAGQSLAGWDGVMFVVQLGAITGAGTLDAYVDSDDNSGFNSATNVTNAALTQVINANTIQILDVKRSALGADTYARCNLVPAVNTVLYAVTAYRYRRAGVLPPTQVAEQTVVIA